MGGLLAWLKSWFKRPDKVENINPEALVPAMATPPEAMAHMTMDQFEARQLKLHDKITAELKQAHAEDRAQLQAQLDAVNARLAAPEVALEEAQKRIRDLEALLDRAGNEVGGDRLAEAKTALEAGDYSVADEIFSSIEAKQAMAVQATARAAFGRGEIAEAEVRWLDAAEHYGRAARLEGNFEHLRKAAEFARRSGDYDTALTLGAQALKLGRNLDDKVAYGAMLSDQGLTLYFLGRFDEAEALHRQVIKIAKDALGEAHPDYGKSLNNLAGVLWATGRLDEAEILFRQSMQITKDAVGEMHLDYGTRLNNLAGVLRSTRHFDEAEVLFRQSMQITKYAVGEAHPDYGANLNNLAVNYAEQGQFSQAIPLMKTALRIYTTALGGDHPDTIDTQNSLDVMKAAAGAS